MCVCVCLTCAALSARWGHAACLLDDKNVLILGGEGASKRASKDSLVRVTLGESSKGIFLAAVASGLHYFIKY